MSTSPAYREEETYASEKAGPALDDAMADTSMDMLTESLADQLSDVRGPACPDVLAHVGQCLWRCIVD